MISPHPASSAPGREGHSGHVASVEERTLRCDRIQIERKTFTLSLRENPRGRFLRITEDVAGRHDTIIVPATGLEEFLALLGNVVRTELEAREGDQAEPPESGP